MRSDFSLKQLLCVTSSNNKDESNAIIATRTGDHDDVESSYQVHDPVIHLEVDEEQSAITQGGKRQTADLYLVILRSGAVRCRSKP